MYKGNMYEFVSKLDKFLKEKKLSITGLKLRPYSMYFSHEEGLYALEIRFTGAWSTVNVRKVYDREDFEEQIYSIINDYIKR